MIAPKNLRYLLLVALLPLTFYRAHAQNIDEKAYLHKMQIIDSLSFCKMNNYDTLYHVSTSQNFRGTSYKEDYYGWIDKQNKEHISFLKINGKEFDIEKKDLTKVEPLAINQETIDSLVSQDKNSFSRDWGSFARDYELVLWLYNKGKTDYSKQLLSKQRTFHGDTDLRSGFGALYYDAMLSAYSYERNYTKAIAFGEHLSAFVFNGYEYQKQAIALTQQLKNNLEDFKTLRLPDSVEWSELKQKLPRKEQILYLADRLRLLNCIQPGQPGWISYDMYQYSVPYTDAGKLNMNYWARDTKYTVINPFIELALMKLNLNEIALLLPYLLTDTYIPSYNYHRDFLPERNLHKLSWVIESLISKITDKRFFKRSNFDTLTSEERKAEAGKIKKWCDDNAGLSPEALTVKELKMADNWNDFYAALQTARQQKNDSLLSVIIQRFNDFNDGSPGRKGILAQTMFETGGEKHIGIVRGWSKDATNIDVNLWTSMFLIKYDKDNYKPAMKALETVLNECDGTTYYPHAIDLLLSTNKPEALKLAEGILHKNGFQQVIYWDYDENFVRKLLFAKSDYTFKFLSAKLDAYAANEMKNSHNDNDHMLTQNDAYVLTVDELKSDTPGYYHATTNTARLAYIKEISKWFKTQYALFKEGKPNELHLAIKQADAPVTFVDTYYR